jgi:hypothetical protein
VRSRRTTSSRRSRDRTGPARPNVCSTRAQRSRATARSTVDDRDGLAADLILHAELVTYVNRYMATRARSSTPGGRASPSPSGRSMAASCPNQPRCRRPCPCLHGPDRRHLQRHPHRFQPVNQGERRCRGCNLAHRARSTHLWCTGVEDSVPLWRSRLCVGSPAVMAGSTPAWPLRSMGTPVGLDRMCSGSRTG